MAIIKVKADKAYISAEGVPACEVVDADDAVVAILYSTTTQKARKMARVLADMMNANWVSYCLEDKKEIK